MNNIKLFISFSSKDLQYVREIMSGLKSQHIDFWDYSDEIQSIEAGEKIPDRLIKEIKTCDFFLPLISKNSLDPEIGKFTRLEIEYAIKLGLLENKTIIPITLLTGTQFHHKYNGPYTELEYILHESFELNNISSYVKLLTRICARLNQTYIPQIEAHPRLPFWKLFRDEVMKMVYSNHTHVELLTILGEFNEYFKKSNWEKAHFLISHFISSCQYRIPNYKIFDDALNSYLRADKIKTKDENVFGGIGSIYMKKRDYVRAEEYFKKSLEYCPANQNQDERINHIVSLIELGKEISKHDKDFIFNFNISTITGLELTNIYNIQMALNYRSENFSRIVELFKEMKNKNIQNTTSIVYYHLCQKALLDLKEAENVLLSAIISDEDIKYDKFLLYQYLSDFYLEYNRVSEAILIYEKYLLNPDQRTRQLMLKYARIFKNIGEYSKMKEVCEEMLSYKLFSIPNKKEDFYYDGFAWYLLGNEERAKYDYDRSTGFDLYYSEYEG